MPENEKLLGLLSRLLSLGDLTKARETVDTAKESVKDRYKTKLSEKDEARFQQWYNRYASMHGLSMNPDDVEHYYDYRGYWKQGTKARVQAYTSDHLPDKFKVPGHPTFSNESIYYKYAPEKAGHWEGDVFVPPVRVIDQDDIRLRQRWAESSFNDRAVSKAGAKGAFQIMPKVYDEYSKKMGKTGDLLDAKYNGQLRDYIWNDLYNSFTASTGNPTDEVRTAKALAMYNRGRDTVGNWLAEQKKAGVDIYNSTDWIDSMPWQETRDYVNFILRGQDTGGNRTADAFKAGREKYGYASGGKIHIKPSHRGRLTELKEKTGKSESELYNDGNPAHKKMVVFARNARKWKHSDGGLIERFGVDAVRAALQKRFRGGGDIDEEPEEYYDGQINTAVKKASLPGLDTSKGKRYARNMAARVMEGKMGIMDVPPRYRGYVSGEVAGMKVAKGRDAFASEYLFPAVIGLAAGPGGAASALAGSAVNMATNASTGGSADTWADLLVDKEKHPLLHTLTEFTNPGYLIPFSSVTGEVAENSRRLQKAKELYNLGRHPVDLPDFDQVARRYATETKPFTRAEKQEITKRILSREDERARRLFGNKFNEVFEKHATTPQLKKIFKENPEYLYYIDQTGADPLAQETIDAFGKRQARSVRGFHTDKATGTNIYKVATEFRPDFRPGGDRLHTGGGVYSSNSNAIADRFSRPMNDVNLDSVIAEIQYPYVRTGGSARQQLRAIRDNVLNREDWYTGTDVALGNTPNLPNWTFVEEQYATRNGNVLNAFERATTKPQDVSGITPDIRHGLQNMKGRWGQDVLPFVAGDERLFIPKVTTRADLPKILDNGRLVYNQNRYADYMTNIKNQLNKRKDILRGSLPYKLGNHVYENMTEVGGKQIYAPLLYGAGTVGAGGLLMSGLLYGAKKYVDKYTEQQQKKLDAFHDSDIYKNYLDENETRSPEKYEKAFKEFMKTYKE